MATTPSLRSVHRNPVLHHHQQNHHHDNTFLSRKLSLGNLFNTSSLSCSLTTTFSVNSTSTSTSATGTSLDALAQHLASQDLRQADEETRRLLIAFAGEAAVKRGYVFFSEVKFISPSDLQAIDHLWRTHSDNRFGYSVQKRIWERKAKKDFTQFFIKVGWMRKLDTEVEQWNYRSFPTEFVWELKDDTPEGHLPLTNALRGTQLLTSILTHPAFETSEEDDDDDQPTAAAAEGSSSLEQGVKERPSLLGGKIKLKPADYSF